MKWSITKCFIKVYLNGRNGKNRPMKVVVEESEDEETEFETKNKEAKK